MADSPFVPGARVAYSSPYRDGYEERFVEKVHKNGNFTLRGDPGKNQWRPSCYRWGKNDRLDWSANRTGGHYNRERVRFWDDAADTEIREEIADANRKRRWTELRQRLERVRPEAVTDAMLDAIEAALPPKAEAAK